MIFLMESNRKLGKLAAFEKFSDAVRRSAEDTRFDIG
jgi:hypothetical protein